MQGEYFFHRIYHSFFLKFCTVPPVEYLFGSIFWLVLFLFGILCFILVVTPKRLSVSLQKLMFLLLSIHSGIRTFHNLFDFIEKFGFDFSEETNNFVRNVNNVCFFFFSAKNPSNAQKSSN